MRNNTAQTNREGTPPSVEIFHAGQDLLGEGILWIKSLDSLVWVDIERSRLFKQGILDETPDCWVLETKPTSIAAWCETRLLLTTERGLSVLDLSDDQLHEILVLCDASDDVRMNDGATDPQGRFWFGSMDLDGHSGNGKLYCLHGDGTVDIAMEGIGIGNGIAFANSGKIMYFADSAAGTIYRCEVDSRSAKILTREVFVGPHLGPGIPDGAAVDRDGCLWSCRWDGWSICRFDTDGTLDQVYELPVQRPTRCTFGGSDLRTLYVTTARIGLGEAELTKQSEAGSVLSLRVSHTGVESQPYSGSEHINLRRRAVS